MLPSPLLIFVVISLTFCKTVAISAFANESEREEKFVKIFLISPLLLSRLLVIDSKFLTTLAIRSSSIQRFYPNYLNYFLNYF